MVVTCTPLAGLEWVYPCTIEDLTARLAEFPLADLEGLRAVRLIPSTCKEHSANGRYFFAEPPHEIHLYAHAASLEFKLPFRGHRATLEALLPVQLEYGTQLIQRGASWFTRWSPEDLREFALRHVLAHEVGHHVYHYGRMKAGYVFAPRTRESEQFAEAYALRESGGRR